MLIRKAEAKDASSIAPLLYIAMEDIIAQFIQNNDVEKGHAFLHHFIQSDNNQYSWQNCWVMEQDHKIVSAVCVYDGAYLQALRQPVLDYLATNYDRHIQPSDETQSGEWYIDSLGVDTSMQGKGLGKKMIQHLISHYVIENKCTLGLLVDFDNPKAKSLYEHIGFKTIGLKELMGHQLYHMQYQC